MKSTRLSFSAILCVLLLAANGWTQPKEVPVGDQSAAPIGTYAPAQLPVVWDPFSSFPTNRAPLFTLHLDTNGTYLAEYTEQRVPTQDGDLFRLLPKTTTARGTWRWDAEKREFRLEPGDFVFYIKCLPVDKQHTNRLVWGGSWLVREEDK